jgi:hypothetical protein
MHSPTTACLASPGGLGSGTARKLREALLTLGSFAQAADRLRPPGGLISTAGRPSWSAGHQARGGMDVYQPRWSERIDFVLDSSTYLEFDAA